MAHHTRVLKHGDPNVVKIAPRGSGHTRKDGYREVWLHLDRAYGDARDWIGSDWVQLGAGPVALHRRSPRELEPVGSGGHDREGRRMDAGPRYRCPACGCVGTEDAMEADATGDVADSAEESWSNWICPACKAWWRLEDYEPVNSGGPGDV